MERLTVDTHMGAALAMGEDYPNEAAAIADLAERYRVAVAKLADYEDTELEPEEVAVLMGENEVLRQEVDRLKEEIRKLQRENFWLTGGLGREE